MSNIFYKIKNHIYILIENISQYFLRKKYQKYDIPIKRNNNWYYKVDIVSNNKNKSIIRKNESSLLRHFEEYTNYGLHYHYIYGTFKDISKNKIDFFQNNTHSHDFYQVMEIVYDYPESFEIPKDSINEYSKQEIAWINALKKKCINDNLKDISYFTDSKSETILVKDIFNLKELEKRNIKKLHGINIKKYFNKDIKYITFDENYKIKIIEK